MNPPTPSELRSLIANERSSLAALRQDLHRHPEIRYEEERTSAVIQEELGKSGVTHRSGLARGTGVLAHLPGGKEGAAAIGLRADIDALPITEANTFPHASQRPGFMHACGHDGHTAILLGTARVLAKIARKSRLPRPVTFLFQPAEEGGAGAEKMVADGCLDGTVLGPPVSQIFGLHGWPSLPLGMTMTRPGPITAACEEFEITLAGKGGHAAFPHLTHDPLVAAAELVLALQSVVSRNVDPLEPAVLSVTRIHGGSATNVIPPAVSLHGTVRTLSTGVMDLIKRRIPELSAAVASGHHCSAEIAWRDTPYPVLSNDAESVRLFEEIARTALGEENVRRMAAPVMGGEDFAFYSQQIPACFFVIGLLRPGEAAMPGLHDPSFDFTDEAIPTGIELFCRLALRDAA